MKLGKLEWLASRDGRVGGLVEAAVRFSEYATSANSTCGSNAGDLKDSIHQKLIQKVT